MRPQTFLNTLTQMVASNDGPGWGTLFIAAPAQKGLVTKAQLVTSLADHDALYGGRFASSELRDQLEAFFAEGGKKAYVLRLSRGGVKATIPVTDGAAATLVTVNAKSVGPWANGYQMITSAVSITARRTW